MKKKFDTPQQMVNWLMENEGLELGDEYGRKWKYLNYEFYFRDIGTHSEYVEKISCLHLFKHAMPLNY